VDEIEDDESYEKPPALKDLGALSSPASKPSGGPREVRVGGGSGVAAHSVAKGGKPDIDEFDF
jgi:hypothetical protein